MAKSENPEQEEQAKATGGGRGMSYPAVPLNEAVDRARKFWEFERKNAAPMDAAASHWGYSPSSSGVRTLVAALLSYGLMVDKGSGNNRQVQLSERALDIVLDTPDRQKALIAAVKAPKIYAELLSEWDPANLPSDQTIKAHLLRHKNFNPKAVDSFVKDFKSSIGFSGLGRDANMPVSETGTGVTTVEAAIVERRPQEHPNPTLFFPQEKVGKQVGAAIPVTPTCSMSIVADGEVTQDGLEKLKLYIDLIKGSFPKTSLETLLKDAQEAQAEKK